MAKTKEITVTAEGVTIGPKRNNQVTVTVDSPVVEELLDGIVDYGLIEYIGNHLSPDEAFEEKKMAEWAEKNGFTKAQ
jgi:hypothetical protein